MHRWVRIFLPLVLIGALPVHAPSVHAAPRDAVADAPRELIVKWKAGTDPRRAAQLRRDLNAVRVQSLESIHAEVILLSDLPPQEAMALLRGSPDIEYVEPNYIVTAHLVPDDPRFPEQWALENTGQTGGLPGAHINAPLAWEVFTGSPNVVVGIVDTGVDFLHPDLASRIWTNPGEIAANGVDDDENGYVDDVHGWDFVNEDNDPTDDNGHGTHVSGIIGAAGNNGQGVTGVAWDVRLLPLKFLNAGGQGSVAGAVRALAYATAMGARLTNNSWGGSEYSQALADAVQEAGAAGRLLVASAGNTGSDNDVIPTYPASFPFPNVIAVAATDHEDHLAAFSSYGATSVDLAAPGVRILSTLPGARYGLLSGTSMAAPHVSGALALLFGRFPSIAALDARDLLLRNVDPLSGLSGVVATGGRLNAFLPIADPDSIAPAPILDLRVTETGSDWLRLAWTSTGDDGAQGRAYRYDLRISTTPIDESNIDLATRVTGLPRPAVAGNPETFRVTGLDFRTTYHVALRAQDEFSNPSALGPGAIGATLGPPSLALNPEEIAVTLASGTRTATSFNIANTGEGTLDFTIPPPEFLLGNPAARREIGALGAGGPDAFGYRWRDSREPGGPEFAWVEVGADGETLLTAGDDVNAGPFPIGFAFPFYGGTYATFRVASNGWLSFESEGNEFENQPLPATGAPGALVAPFWDDLRLAPGSVRARREAERLVVSWEGVDRAGGEGAYTFETILHADGTIDFQYLRLGTPRDEATVGIQDAAGRRGLQIAFNTPFAQDSLAVRIQPLPVWLTLSPTQGTLRAPESAPIAVNVDASGLPARRHEAWIRIRTNDPLRREALVPVVVDVTGAPDIDARPDSIRFAAVPVGGSGIRIVTVENPGTDVLSVAATIVGANGVFAADPAAFTVAPRAKENVTVAFAPSSVDTFTAVLRLSSNDPDEPIFQIPLGGAGVPAPVLGVEPESLVVALVSGRNEERAVLLRNLGPTPFTYRVDVEQGTRPDPAPGPALAKGAADPRVGILGTGGPDGFGYRWDDSHEADGPPFGWIDISGTGLPVFPMRADEAVAGPFEIGFPFSYYGGTFTSLRVFADGFLSFTSSTADYTNDPLPSPDAPENLLAPFWDDLVVDPAAGGQVYVARENGSLIVQYENVTRFLEETEGTYSFQVQLRRDGSIRFLYRSMGPTRNLATVGIQNGRRDDGLTVAFNRRYVEPGLALRFTPVRWLSAGPSAGTVAAGGSVTLTARFDAAGLAAGTYRGRLAVQVGDPPLVEIPVPAVLGVSGAPSLAVDADHIDFGEVYGGFPQARTLVLRNAGTDALHVTGLSIVGSGFAICCPEPETPFTLSPGAESALQVSALAGATGPAQAVLRIVTDDPERPALDIGLAASVLPAPLAAVEPTSLAASLRSGDTQETSVTIANRGGSPYRFIVEARASNAAAALSAITRPPDAFGYSWTDTNDPQGPPFDWLDISATGRALFAQRAEDETTAPLPLGFLFPFYGAVFESVRVCTNGWLSFTNSGRAHENVPLPNASVAGIPENLIAPFWDDLDVRPAEGGQVYAAALPDRFVVEWARVHRFGQTTGGTSTFQAQLFPDGTLLFQYQDPGPVTESATVGIQNGARNDGLTVVFDAPYLRKGLAVRIASRPSWLRAVPAAGEVAPGAVFPVSVHFDAAGLLTGDYQGMLRFLGNDPRTPAIEVPVALHVDGVPAFAAEPETLDFGTAYQGYAETLEVAVRNPGTAPLQVSRVLSDDDAFLAEPTAFQVPPFGTVSVAVIFRPETGGDDDEDHGDHDDHGDDHGRDDHDDHRGGRGHGVGPQSRGEDAVHAGTLRFWTNAAPAAYAIALTGAGVPPPQLHASPRALAVALDPGQTADRQLTLQNQGRGELAYEIDVNLSADPVPGYAALGIDPGKHDEDPRVGFLSRGGPDAFGYRFTDSDEPGGPSFDWRDVRDTGTPLFPNGVDDGNVGPLSLGFAFPFYGTSFDTCRISPDGFLSFTSRSHRFTNEPFPSDFATTPENAVAVLWDDFRAAPAEGGQVFAAAFPDRFVVQYESLTRVNRGGNPYTFQVQLFPDGVILCLYQRLGLVTDSATIGIQNAGRDDGLTVVFNAPYVREGLAVRFRPPTPWLRVDPAVGALARGETARPRVTFDAVDLAPGRYSGEIVIRSNDPAAPRTVIPVTLEVSGAAMRLEPATASVALSVFALSPPSPSPFAERTTLSFALAEPGTARLLVVDVSGRRVRTLVDAPLPAGPHDAMWDGRDDAGRRVASGLYLATLTTGKERRVQRMFLVR